MKKEEATGSVQGHATRMLNDTQVRFGEANHPLCLDRASGYLGKPPYRPSRKSQGQQIPNCEKRDSQLPCTCSILPASSLCAVHSQCSLVLNGEVPKHALDVKHNALMAGVQAALGHWGQGQGGRGRLNQCQV